MFIPYRVKNPAKTFPVATITIIALNVLVLHLYDRFSATNQAGDHQSYAFALGGFSRDQLFHDLFPDMDPFHLIGNMWFLWIFGPPVEDRLGRMIYPILYFTAGLAGDLAQAMLDHAVFGHARMCIGASGCIMVSWGPIGICLPGARSVCSIGLGGSGGVCGKSTLSGSSGAIWPWTCWRGCSPEWPAWAGVWPTSLIWEVQWSGR